MNERREQLAWIGGGIIIAMTLLRTVVAFTPRVLFDFDPALDPEPFPGFGPVGSLTVDLIMLIGAAVAIAGWSAWPMRRALLLALLPVPAAFMHAIDPAEAWRVVSWIAAIVGAVALTGVAMHPGRRAVLLSILIAGMVPALLRGVLQVEVGPYVGLEHAERLAEFEAGKAELFANHGWTDESTGAKEFERRLRDARPTGWFRTTNIFGSLAAFASIVALGAAMAARRRRDGWWGLVLVFALIAGAGVLLTGSKGAIGAVAVGGLWLLLRRMLGARPAGYVAIALLVAAIGAVLVRGAMLPQDFLGDRSLLFRSFYLDATTRIVADAPLRGVGPADFQEAYVLHRPAESPEEVGSAHCTPADWLAGIGAFALGWIAFGALLVWRAATREHSGPAEPVATIGRSLVGLVAIGAFLPPTFAEAGDLDPISAVLRIAGIAAFAFVAFALIRLWERSPCGYDGVVPGAAAIVLAVHAQIEMTAVEPGSAAFVLAALALVGARPDGGAAAPRGRVLAVFPFVLALATIFPLVQAVQLRSLLRDAASELAPFARIGAAFRMASQGFDRVGALDTARNELAGLGASREQLRDVGLMPNEEPAGDPREALQSLMAQLEYAARRRAAATLALPRGDADLAARQLAAAALLADSDEHDELASIAESWLKDGTSIGELASLSRVFEAAGQLERAVECARGVVALDPNGLEAWKRLSALLWTVGDREAALAADARVLEIDAAWALDPVQQLTETEREAYRSRVEGDGAD